MYVIDMTRPFIRSLAILAIAAGSFVAVQAQLPTDNPVWKTRCNLLAASASDINKGSAPAALVAATRGISGAKFLSLAAESSDAGNHNVACTLFYLSAVADRAGNGGGKTDASASGTAATLAASERKLIAGQSISISDHMAWAGIKLSLFRAGGLSSSETGAVLAAATTMPLSLQQAPPEEMASLRGKGR